MNRRNFLKLACYAGATALFASYPLFIERNLVSKSFIQRVVKKANRLEPDMIVCTGDYVHAGKSTKEIDTELKQA